MTTARRRCVVLVAAGLSGLALGLITGCTGDDDGPTLRSLEFSADDDGTVPPAAGLNGEPTPSAVAPPTYLGSYRIADEEFGAEVTVTVGRGLRIIESNALPDHGTGSFPNPQNPNAITGQTLRYEFSTDARHLGRAAAVETPAVAINGVAFESGTSESVTCQSGERYQVEALQDRHDLGLDANNAHVHPTGTYHYHGLPPPLAAAGTDHPSGLVHVGFAADGFLVFASPDGAHRPSYRLATEPRTGTGCRFRETDVAIDGTAPDGTYQSDWVHDPEAGDLDVCNGTTVDGDYLYLITEGYPHVPRCLMGDAPNPGPVTQASDGGRGGGSSGDGGSGGGQGRGDDRDG